MRTLGVLVLVRGDLRIHLDPTWRPPVVRVPDEKKEPVLEKYRHGDDRGLRGVRRPRVAS